MQRAPLLAITSCYKTASTNCLSVVAGALPLDLEVRRIVQKDKHRQGECTLANMRERLKTS
ncbi:Reverse transcriptase domain-containing protein [Aphis craccivora]|uniref:Reverse transcriptase domain-containing protein n=1 Tax=Aphis craccivora TaxID=307492 RepID=A0A6G0Y971_APHCR|nr:Reverse transcriptase domain-containing protein [Aphis craccivora]